MKYIVQFQTQWHLWKHFGTYHGRNSAYMTAQAKAKQQQRRFRIVDENNNLIDLFNP